MNKRFCVSICIFLLSFSLCGCVPLLVGAAVGAAGGYAVSKDTIEGETDKDYDRLWDAAVNVSQAQGFLAEEDAASGFLRTETESGHAIVTLTRLTKTTTCVRVTARKRGFPHLTLAEDMFVKILEDAS